MEPTFSTEEMEMYQKMLAMGPKTKAGPQTGEKGKSEGNPRRTKKERVAAKRKGKKPNSGNVVTSPFDTHAPMEQDAEDSDDSDLELDAATANQYLNILGRARNLMMKEDLKYVGDIKDHLDDCKNLLRGLRCGNKDNIKNNKK